MQKKSENHGPDNHSCCPHHSHKSDAPLQAASPGAIYTCPMHPQIRQQGPGSCPLCGMAL
jgi:Cu+-exporting ATPase